MVLDLREPSCVGSPSREIPPSCCYGLLMDRWPVPLFWGWRRPLPLGCLLGGAGLLMVYLSLFSGSITAYRGSLLGCSTSVQVRLFPGKWQISLLFLGYFVRFACLESGSWGLDSQPERASFWSDLPFFLSSWALCGRLPSSPLLGTNSKFLWKGRSSLLLPLVVPATTTLVCLVVGGAEALLGEALFHMSFPGIHRA